MAFHVTGPGVGAVPVPGRPVSGRMPRSPAWPGNRRPRLRLPPNQPSSRGPRRSTAQPGLAEPYGRRPRPRRWRKRGPRAHVRNVGHRRRRYPARPSPEAPVGARARKARSASRPRTRPKSPTLTVSGAVVSQLDMPPAVPGPSHAPPPPCAGGIVAGPGLRTCGIVGLTRRRPVGKTVAPLESGRAVTRSQRGMLLPPSARVLRGAGRRWDNRRRSVTGVCHGLFGHGQPTNRRNNAVRRDASPLEGGGDFRRGRLEGRLGGKRILGRRLRAGSARGSCADYPAPPCRQDAGVMRVALRLPDGTRSRRVPHDRMRA